MVCAFDVIDYVTWLLSEASAWLPKRHHEFLLVGMKQWTAWIRWYREGELPEDEANRVFLEALYDCPRSRAVELPGPAMECLSKRIARAGQLLHLPEGAETLAQRFLAAGFIEAFFEVEKGRQVEE